MDMDEGIKADFRQKRLYWRPDHQRTITIVIASTVRKAITRSSLRCDGLRMLICLLLQKTSIFL